MPGFRPFRCLVLLARLTFPAALEPMLNENGYRLEK